MKQIVYLAGGFRSQWQSIVKSECIASDGTSLFNWEDPFEKERGKFAEKKEWTAREYTQMDLHMIRKSDIIFVYLEKANPGLGSIAEASYAKGLGKTVILIREQPHEIHTDRYLDFLEEMCDITFDNLKDGIIYLRSFK